MEPHHLSVSSHAVAAAHIEEPELKASIHNYVLGKGEKKKKRIVPLQNSYVEALTTSTSECNLIWR